MAPQIQSSSPLFCAKGNQLVPMLHNLADNSLSPSVLSSLSPLMTISPSILDTSQQCIYCDLHLIVIYLSLPHARTHTRIHSFTPTFILLLRHTNRPHSLRLLHQVLKTCEYSPLLIYTKREREREW